MKSGCGKGGSVDLAFMIGCNVGMDGYVNSTSSHLSDIVREIKSKQNIKQVNVALILYRDRSCEVNRYTLPFTNGISKAKKFIAKKCR